MRPPLTPLADPRRPPGSGKSTFLKTLAGLNHSGRSGLKVPPRRREGAVQHTWGAACPCLAALRARAAAACWAQRPPWYGCPRQVEAEELTYNGHSMDEFVVERSAAYVSQAHPAAARAWPSCCALACPVLHVGLAL